MAVLARRVRWPSDLAYLPLGSDLADLYGPFPTLDGEPCSHALSVSRKLFRAYAGPLFQLKSNGVLTEIHTLSTGLVDEEAILSHCGANVDGIGGHAGTVERVYEQVSDGATWMLPTNTTRPAVYNTLTGIHRVGSQVALFSGSDLEIALADPYNAVTAYEPPPSPPQPPATPVHNPGFCIAVACQAASTPTGHTVVRVRGNAAFAGIGPLDINRVRVHQAAGNAHILTAAQPTYPEPYTLTGYHSKNSPIRATAVVQLGTSLASESVGTSARLNYNGGYQLAWMGASNHRTTTVVCYSFSMYDDGHTDPDPVTLERVLQASIA